MFLLIFDILGTIAFAISGAMKAIKVKMDLLGVIVLGVSTAIGGGIIRDIILGIIPPQAFVDCKYALISVITSIIVFIPSVRNKINEDDFFLNFIDAIGLGTFTVIGTLAGFNYGGMFLQVFLGVITGVGGGVLRDIFAGDKPMIFVKHFYALASIIGGIMCSILFKYNQDIAMIVGILVTTILRVLAAKFKWHLPKA